MPNPVIDAGAEPKGSALLSAARCRNRDISSKMVEALLKKGADPNYREHYYMGDAKRFSMPLHAACYQGNYPVAQLLLRQPALNSTLLISMVALRSCGRWRKETKGSSLCSWKRAGVIP